MKVKSHLLLFLINIITVQINNSNNIFSDYSIWIGEMNGSNITRDWKEELGILYYKSPALAEKQYNVIWK